MARGLLSQLGPVLKKHMTLDEFIKVFGTYRKQVYTSAYYGHYSIEFLQALSSHFPVRFVIENGETFFEETL